MDEEVDDSAEEEVGERMREVAERGERGRLRGTVVAAADAGCAGGEMLR